MFIFSTDIVNYISKYLETLDLLLILNYFRILDYKMSEFTFSDIALKGHINILI